VAAIIGAIFYFSPLYLEGLAEHWEIIVFVIGILLILTEIFILPGFGIAGISGIILMVTGLTFAMIDNQLFYHKGTFDFIVLVKPVSIVLLSTFISLSLSIYLAGKLFKNDFLPGIALKTVLNENDGYVSSDSSLRSLNGSQAIVMTEMRPSGKIEINGKWYEATMSYGIAKKGDVVKVIRSEGGRLYCEHLAQ
ncbi:MAG: nodulation protein NfeD, partial [Bacteroidia bacterium]|nr:nodulation protein NfeD [Bacteroidia bacterium]